MFSAREHVAGTLEILATLCPARACLSLSVELWVKMLGLVFSAPLPGLQPVCHRRAAAGLLGLHYSQPAGPGLQPS